MMLQAYVWAALLLPVWAVLMWPPLRAASTTSTMTIAEIGFLRAGALGALGTAATELYVDDLVTVERRGLVRGPGHLHTGVSPLGQAVYSAAVRRAGLRRLRLSGDVRKAVSQLRRRLAQEGLIPGRMRWFLARTVLLALATVSVLELLTGPSTPFAGMLCIAVLLAVAAASLVPRRTIAGQRRMAALQRGKGEVVLSADKRGDVWVMRDEPALAFALDGHPLPALIAVMRLDPFSRARSAFLGLLSYERTHETSRGWSLDSTWSTDFYLPGQASAGPSGPGGVHGGPSGTGTGPSGAGAGPSGAGTGPSGPGGGPSGTSTAGGGSGPARFQ